MNEFAKSVLTCGVILFSLIAAAAQTAPEAEGGAAGEKLVAAGFGGAWRLNGGESDDPLEKMRELVAGRAAQAREEPAENRQLPPLTVSIFPPDALVLVAGENGEVTINETFRDVVQTRTVVADGRMRAVAIGAGASCVVGAVRDGARLTVETVSPRGNRMTETYEPAPDGKKLRVTIRVENYALRETLTLRRVYDRASPLAEGFEGE